MEEIEKKIKFLKDQVNGGYLLINDGFRSLLDIIEKVIEYKNTEYDTLGDCSGCGAKDGQRCYRYCEKR